MKTPTNQALADALSISVRRVSELKKAGMPCHTISAAKAWRGKQAASLRSKSDSAEELRRKRIKLVAEQTKREELENSRRRNELMPRSEHVELSIASAVAAKMALWSLINSLPPVLAGLPETPIAMILEREFRQVLERLHHGDPALWESPIGKAIFAELENRIPSPNKKP